MDIFSCIISECFSLNSRRKIQTIQYLGSNFLHFSCFIVLKFPKCMDF